MEGISFCATRGGSTWVAIETTIQNVCLNRELFPIHHETSIHLIVLGRLLFILFIIVCWFEFYCPSSSFTTRRPSYSATNPLLFSTQLTLVPIHRAPSLLFIH